MIAEPTTIEAPAETALTRDERIQLGQLEAIIERGLKTFFEVGAALNEISEKQLYRAKYTSFADYCDQQWNMSRFQAYRLIGAAEVVNNLLPIGNILPANESQARPLTGLEPEQQRAAWEQAVTAANGQPTAVQVKQATAAYQYPNSQEPRQPWELQNDMIAWLVLQPAESRLEIALGWQEQRNNAPYWREMVATLPTPWRSSDLTKAIDGTVTVLQKHDGELVKVGATAPPGPAVAASISRLEMRVYEWLKLPDTATMGHADPLDHLVDIKEKRHGWGVAWNNLKWGLDSDGVTYRASDLHQACNNVLDQYRVRRREQAQKIADTTPVTIPTADFRDAIYASIHAGPKADAVIHHVFFHNSRPHIATSAVYHPDGREEYEAYELVDLSMYRDEAGRGLYGGLPVRYVEHGYRLGNPVTFVYEPAPAEESVDPWQLLKEKLAALDADGRDDLTDLLTSTAASLGEANPAAAEFVAAVVALLMSQEVAA